MNGLAEWSDQRDLLAISVIFTVSRSPDCFRIGRLATWFARNPDCWDDYSRRLCGFLLGFYRGRIGLGWPVAVSVAVKLKSKANGSAIRFFSDLFKRDLHEVRVFRWDMTRGNPNLLVVEFRTAGQVEKVV